MARRFAPFGPRRVRRPALMLAVALLAAAGWTVVWATDGLHTWEVGTVDARFRLRGARPAQNFAVIELDDATIGELGERPPLRRSRYATAIDKLRRAGARLIVFDIQFTEPTRMREDNALIEALGRARPTVLSTTETDGHGHTAVLGGEDTQRAFGVRVGSTLLPNDSGGVIRRMDYSVDGLKGLWVVAAETLWRRPVRQFGSALIDYAGPPGTIQAYSLIDVLRDRLPAGAVAGRIVVVGAAAPSLGDVHPTPTSPNGAMNGPEVIANTISTVLRDRPLRDPSWPVAVLAIVLCAALVPLAGLRLTPLRSQALGLAFAACFVVAAQALFDHGLVLPVIAPAGALLCAAIGALAVHYALSASEQRRTHELFARFVGEPVVRELLTRQDGGLLGGVRRDGTVLFADLHGFTALAERLEPEATIEVMNRYLGEMSDAVMAQRGTLVSFLGDGVMAVFGAPLEQPDHADRALAAAREMLDIRLPRVNDWLRAQALSEPLRMGIGMSSGDVMSGHVGSARRVEYAAVGDTTNVASRLETLTRDLGAALLISDATRSRLSAPPEDLLSLGELKLRGRDGRIVVWALDRASHRIEEHTS
ncbi:adenylate/guanylate cyclase domain-containing protein [Solirubrobacter ginsenosidimutans]|uniref:Adenylate/guanylate cyclase domain-containing protein n=1 Tax=Solirubrobacter ginsenosidimutans TaxID=490573 RepID=A0A9X3S5N7_9ACTN|nr:adenylate/guanylate cyclase domain-containing protein [Solirubrobacter ginsenosidimutans]MDA0166979.1 adenylate/guanylate cyclase domain-containing protein [Solirubrobacter ginsenosidimutans]